MGARRRDTSPSVPKPARTGCGMGPTPRWKQCGKRSPKTTASSCRSSAFASCGKWRPLFHPVAGDQLCRSRAIWKPARPRRSTTLIKSAPKGTALTREYIRAAEAPDREGRAGPAEGRAPPPSRGPADGVAKRLARQLETGKRRSASSGTPKLCRSVGKEPEPFSPPLAPEDEPASLRRRRPGAGYSSAADRHADSTPSRPHQAGDR